MKTTGLRAGRTIAWALAGLSAFFIAWPQAGAAPAKGFGLRLALTGLAADEVAPLQRYIDEAETLIPPRVKQRVPVAINVRFLPLDRRATVEPPPCKPLPRGAARQLLAVSSGVGERHVILLHAGWKAVIIAGPTRSATYECGHRSLYRLALATLLHEVMHIFDQSAKLSADRRYREVHRFDRQAPLFHLRSRNELSMRSPDPYELYDIRENLAVNAEFFLLDPEYRCRRPTSYEFLESALGYRPFPRASCAVNLIVPVAARAVSLDPDRIYQIHYLLAGPGPRAQSRFGHAMYRIVLCAPERLRVDAGCLDDLQHHVVLSFAANLRGEPRISILRGLSGGYATQVSIAPFLSILSQYTEVELRDLESLPLRLRDEERARFIYRALEVYWGYVGKYYFLTNNCLSEARSLLQAVSPSAQQLHSATPVGFYEELVRTKLGDDSALRDRENAEREGYRFRGLLAAYQQRLVALHPYLPPRAPRGLERFLDTSALQRWGWFLPALRDPAAVAHFYALENMVQRQRAKELESKIIQFYYRLEREPRHAALRQALSEILAQSNQREPWQRARHGYGIPFQDELFNAEDEAAQRVEQTLLPAARIALKNEFPRELQELTAVQDNLERLRGALLESAAAPSPLPQN